jgi:gliding motility-associated lipoprotein GldH
MVLRNHKIGPLVLWIFLMGWGSCSSPVASQQQLHLADALWNKYNNLELALAVPDTSSLYHAWLDVRVTRDYPYSYLSVVVTHPGAKDTLWFPLIPEKALPSGRFLDYRFALDSLGFRPNASVYSWRIAHNMPEKTLQGVVLIGVLMKETGYGQR